MPAPGQRLSPAELAALEHAFAVDPASDAYRPLAEAYLTMSRFMEAMVVCKKGIKSHPNDVSARVLLARVYAAQGKDAKALEELGEALKLAPRDVAALRLAASLHFQAGRRDAGATALRSAWEAAPDDPETLAIMKKLGVFAPAPAEAPKARGTQPQGARAPTPAPTATRVPGATPVPARVERAQTPTPGAARPPPADAGAAATPARPPAARPADAAAYAEQLASQYGTQELPLHREHPRRRRAALVATAVLGVALAVVLAATGIARSVRHKRAVEIDHLLRQARELIEKDSFASYKDAAQLCERILQVDRDALGGHAYLAYIDAIRWGELGGGEALRTEAQKHLDAVKRSRQGHSHAYAADAYLTFYGGDPRTAVAELQKVLAGPEGASALLHGVLGVIDMQSGDLDGAREALSFARQHAPGDVRSAYMLAEQWRRRGQGYEPQATALYDAVLTRLAPDHVPSLLGKAQLLLDAGQPAEAIKRATRVLELGQAASPRQIALAHALRGSALHAQGKSAEGDAQEQQALSLEPTNADVHDLIGRRKLRGNDVAGAVAAFQNAIKLDPQRLGFYVDLAAALMRRPGGAQEAVAALERANERAGNARVTKLLGDAHRAAGDLDRARAAYEKALAMEKKYPEALVALATVDRERKDYAKALEELDRAVSDYGEGSGGAATAWVEKARVEEARGAPVVNVEKAYASALKADPQSCPALYWIGQNRADRRSGAYDPTIANQLLSDYVRLCPKGPHVGDAQRLAASVTAKTPKRRRR